MNVTFTIKMLVLCLAVTLLYSQFHSRTADAQSCGFNSINDYICSDGVPTPPPGNPFTPGGAPPPPVYVPGPPVGGSPPSGDAFTCSGGGGWDMFLEHLKLREGVRNCVYRDSLGKPTVGVGHLVKPEDNLQVGDCISDAQVDAFLQQDAQWAWDAAQQQAEAAGVSDGCFIVALGSVNYQLGSGWRSKFPNTWNMIKNGQYCEAAAALEGTLWNRQTPVRVDDFQAALYQQAENAGTPCN